MFVVSSVLHVSAVWVRGGAGGVSSHFQPNSLTFILKTTMTSPLLHHPALRLYLGCPHLECRPLCLSIDFDLSLLSGQQAVVPPFGETAGKDAEGFMSYADDQARLAAQISSGELPPLSVAQACTDVPWPLFTTSLPAGLVPLAAGLPRDEAAYGTCGGQSFPRDVYQLAKLLAWLNGMLWRS